MASVNTLCKKLLNVKDIVAEGYDFLPIQTAFSIFESRSEHMLCMKTTVHSVIAHVPDTTNRWRQLEYGVSLTGTQLWPKSKVLLIDSTVQNMAL